MRLLDGASDREDRGALVGTRTRDLILTKNVLYQLSYVGPNAIRLAGSACSVGSDGFEPPKLAQLIYSQPQLSTLATAQVHALAKKNAPGADDGTRTRNLLFTKQLLCH